MTDVEGEQSFSLTPSVFFSSAINIFVFQNSISRSLEKRVNSTMYYQYGVMNKL